MQHILVCDDEKDIVAALKIYLESDGYCVHTAYSGEEALRVAKTEPVQLALMDIMMPNMNGYEAAKMIRNMERPDAKTIPIIAMTANAFAKDVQAALDNGMNAHIAKPINMNILVPTIQKYL